MRPSGNRLGEIYYLLNDATDNWRDGNLGDNGIEHVVDKSQDQ